MICVPLDDVEDVLQRRLDDCPAWTPEGSRWREALVMLLHELTALQVDTEAPACPECGDPLPAKSTHCFDCAIELGIVDEAVRA